MVNLTRGAIRDWTAAPPTKRDCGVCRNHPVAAAIRTYLERRAELAQEGKRARGYGDLHALLVAEYGFMLSETRMKQHMRHCEADLYAKANAKS